MEPCQGAAHSSRIFSCRTALTVAGRAVKEYLATLNDAAFGAATEVEPKFVSPPRGALRGGDELAPPCMSRKEHCEG
jgi:hypothetical protein